MTNKVIQEFMIDGKRRILISPDKKKVYQSRSYFQLLQKNDVLYNGQGKIMDYREYVSLKDKKEGTMQVKDYMILLIIYLALLVMFLFRLLKPTKELEIPTKYEVIEHNYDNPKDLYVDTTMSIQERNYYEFLYNKE